MIKSNVKLYDHQRKAVEFACDNFGSACLFMDTGTGKTLTALKLFSVYKKIIPNLKLVVFCPKSLINAAWWHDIDKFCTSREDIQVFNYERVSSSKDSEVIKKMFKLGANWMVVLDESSRLKNHKSKTSKFLLSVAPFINFRIAMSGTPCPNSILELWAQVKFVNNSLFENSYYKFEANNTIWVRGKQRAYTEVYDRKILSKMFSQGWKKEVPPLRETILLQAVSPVCFWLKKETCLDLPEQVDQYREIMLSKEEQKIYNDMRKDLVAELEGVEVAAPISLTKIMKLRQITSGFCYHQGAVLSTGKSTKLETFKEVIEENKTSQIIIWANFKQEIHKLKETLGGDAECLFSETEDKDEVIKLFQENKVKYLIAHPKSAAHGLTFVNCNLQIFYSLDYSFEAYYQAKARNHRIGQTNKCTYVHLICKDTIDEDILSILTKKKSLQSLISKYKSYDRNTVKTKSA